MYLHYLYSDPCLHLSYCYYYVSSLVPSRLLQLHIDQFKLNGILNLTLGLIYGRRLFSFQCECLQILPSIYFQYCLLTSFYFVVISHTFPLSPSTHQSIRGLNIIYHFSQMRNQRFTPLVKYFIDDIVLCLRSDRYVK